MNTNISRSSASRLWSSLRENLHDTREARAKHSTLKRELASYTTRAEVDDLLGSLQGQGDGDVEAMRRILTQNLQQLERPKQLAA